MTTAGHASSATTAVATTGRRVTEPGRNPAFRGDIEGMRGIAVVAVVAFHSGMGVFSGGFVGVDVFFVLSGFLITGLLIDERVRSGGISFVDFYARRARRLLPASVLVLVSTVVLSMVFLSPLDMADLRPQARWVALFGSNIWFSRHATDYMQPDVVSPFQQYWSLAVEEQFYFVWPLLVVCLSLGATNARSVRRRVAIGLGLAVVASFVLAVRLTAVRQPSAFFLLPPRAWELGAGSFLAAVTRLGFRLPGRLVGPLGTLGAVLVLGPVLAYGAGTTFPGWTAVPPVFGTVLLIAIGVDQGTGRGSSSRSRPIVTRALDSAPLRLLGRYSYSLYLWHWPLLVIPASHLGRPLGPRATAVLIGVAGVASVLTFHLVEDRVRHLQPLVRARGASFLLGGALLVVAVLSTRLLPTPAQVERMTVERVLESDTGISRALADSLAAAPRDRGGFDVEGCSRGVMTVEGSDPLDQGPCSSGSPAAPGTPSVMISGDSHAAQWYPALLSAAKRQGWRIISFTRNSCPLVTIPVITEATGTRNEQCDAWRQKVFESIATNPPDALVLAQRTSYYAAQAGADEWLAALEATIGRLAPLTKVIVVRDVPGAPSNVPRCILNNASVAGHCDFDVSEDDQRFADRERAIVETAGGSYVDPVPVVCPDLRCRVVVGNVVVYSDDNHLTGTYAASMGRQFGDLVRTALRD